jgi:Na+-driven multidrug efflux pump
MENSEQDLTIGSVQKKLIKFAMPLFVANLLQSFYSIVDMLVVGRIVGSTGLAAISNASMISFIINSICIGVTMGGTVLVAQCKGANDEQGQKKTIGTLFTISVIASIIVTVIGGSGNYASDEAKEIAALKRKLRDTEDALDVLKKAIGILGN